MKTLIFSRATLHHFCRTCLVPLDETSRRTVSQWMLALFSLSSETLEKEKQEEEKSLPKFLCHECYKKLRYFDDFRTMALRSMQKCVQMLSADRMTKVELADEIVETDQLVAQEHEQVLNEIYGNRDWLEFEDYGKLSLTPTERQQHQTIKCKRKCNRNKETRAENTCNEAVDDDNLVLSSLLESEAFLNESSSNYKQEEVETTETDIEIERTLLESEFEFQDSAAIAEQRDVLEDNEIDHGAVELPTATDIEESESAHESDDDFNAVVEDESIESNYSSDLLENRTKCKRKTPPAAPSNSLCSVSTPLIADAATKNKKLQCEHCPRRCNNPENLEAHMRTHRGLKPFQCPECTRSFNKAYHLRMHTREEHTDDGRQTEITCAFEGCGKRFRRSNTYKAHFRIKHTRDPAMASVRPEKTFVCEVCGRTFKNITILKEHRYKHVPTEEYPYQCAECGKRYTSPRVYKEHLMRHAGIKNYVCPHCGMRKTTRNELRTHINYHTKEKQWPCPHCPSIFNSSANLGMHDRVVHKGIRKFACRFCDLTFGKPDTLKHHEMRHTGERPHKCQMCGKGFIQIVALRAHMKTHNKNGTAVDGSGDDKQLPVETLVHHDQTREVANACLQLVKDLTELHEA